MPQIPSWDYTAPPHFRPLGFRNVPLGEKEGLPRNADDPLVRATRRSEDETGGRVPRNVCPDNGEIAICHFENVRAAGQGAGHFSICVRVGSQASNKHDALPNKC